jgi:hypothetical protein
MTLIQTIIFGIDMAKFNEFIDLIHSFFPTFSMIAFFILLESFLPHKEYFESQFDKILNYSKIPFIAVLNLTLISQSILGGCVLFYAQSWLVKTFLNTELTYEFGLFGRENIDPSYHWLLRVIYILVTILVVYRTYQFFNKRIINTKIFAPNKSEVKLEKEQVQNLRTLSH